MFERQPYKGPMDCFAKEYNSKDEVCATCPYEEECAQFSGDWITLDKVEFDLVPDLLKVDTSEEDPEMGDLEGLYSHCYRMVFGDSKRPDAIGRFPEAKKIIRRASADLNMEPKMFILTVMLGFKASRSDEREETESFFYANMLLGNNAPKRAERYREACQRLYGTFDLQAVTSLTGKVENGLEERLLDSEIAAGAWIVGYKIKKPGKATEALFRSREKSLDPVWLAIEPNYTELILKPHIEHSSADHGLQIHRHKVIQIIRELKRDKKRASMIFGLRQKNMSTAVSEVLRMRSLSPEDFLAEPVPVTDVMRFWSRIGLVLQQINCLRHLAGDWNAF